MKEWQTDELDELASKERPDFMCALTLEIMRDPAGVMRDGSLKHAYEHLRIKKWFDDGNTIEPSTGEDLSDGLIEIVRNEQLQRTIKNWCQEQLRRWGQEGRIEISTPLPTPVAQRTSVHVFVDHSNIAIGAARNTAQALDVASLVRFVEGDRTIHDRVVIGSYQSDVGRAAWEQHGYKVEADRRRGPAHFVDDALHAQLMRTAERTFAPGRILALLTGDGNDNEGRTTFPESVEMALRNDWHVELFTWKRSASRVYSKFQREYSEHFQLLYLDDMRNSEMQWSRA
jgi:hypothetical protein